MFLEANNMKRLIALSLALVLVGCVKPPVEARLDPYGASQIQMASKELRDDTAVGTPVASRDEAGNILYITVPIRAATWQQLYVDYRVTFFDKNHQQLNQTGWFTKVLTPNVPDSITVNSTTSRAADFQVDFRYSK
jgi:hypothetical protein